MKTLCYCHSFMIPEVMKVLNEVFDSYKDKLNDVYDILYDDVQNLISTSKITDCTFKEYISNSDKNTQLDIADDLITEIFYIDNVRDISIIRDQEYDTIIFAIPDFSVESETLALIEESMRYCEKQYCGLFLNTLIDSNGSEAYLKTLNI